MLFLILKKHDKVFFRALTNTLVYKKCKSKLLSQFYNTVRNKISTYTMTLILNRKSSTRDAKRIAISPADLVKGMYHPWRLMRGNFANKVVSTQKRCINVRLC